MPRLRFATSAAPKEDLGGLVVVDPNGKGTLASPKTYAQFCRSIFHELKSDPNLEGALSALTLAYIAMEKEANRAALDVLNERINETQKTIQDLADALNSTTRKEMAQDAISAVPFFGAVANTIWNIVDEATGVHGETESEESNTIAQCQSMVFAPMSAGGKLRPADLFVRAPRFVDGTTYLARSTLGAYLVQATELGPRSYDEMMRDYPRARNPWETTSVHRAAGNNWYKYFQSQTLRYHVSKRDRRLFRMMRAAIESQWTPPYGIAEEQAGKPKPVPRGTGGQELFSAYLDLLHRQYTLGIASEKNPSAPLQGFNNNGLYYTWLTYNFPCFPDYNKSGARGFAALIDASVGSNNPTYSDDAEKLRKELPALPAIVRGKARPHLIAAFERIKPQLDSRARRHANVEQLVRRVQAIRKRYQRVARA